MGKMEKVEPIQLHCILQIITELQIAKERSFLMTMNYDMIFVAIVRNTLYMFIAAFFLYP